VDLDRNLIQRPGGAAGAVRDGRAAEPNTDLMKTLEIAIGQIGEALADVINGLIHPMRLVVQCGLQDTTAIDMAK